MPTYIVIWTEDEEIIRGCKEVEHDQVDHWVVHEDYQSAERMFNELTNEEDVVSCSIVVPVKSSDYDEVIINV